MAVFQALISKHMSNMESSHRVVVIYSGPTSETLTHAGNLVLPKEAADELVAIMDGQDAHVIEIERHGWIVKHPLACRTDLFLCDANGHDLDSEEDGRYVLERDASGRWRVGEKTNG